MASETITRNDLTAILNEVLPPTPSEYRKLLWTNLSPSSSFAAQTISGIDFSGYDEVEIEFIFNTSDTTVRLFNKIQVGSKGHIAAERAQPFYTQYREVTINSNSVVIGDCILGNGTAYNDHNVPYKIYGIKYERVAPPQINGWDYITSVTGSNTVTFEDLAAQGYSEVFVKDSGYSGGYAPVIALPTALVWGGFYSGVNGLLHGVDITATSIKGKYGMSDSTNYLSTMTFYLYAR